MHIKRLILFFLLSFFIHVGVLVGIDVFAPPTPATPELPRLIPVDVVLIEERPSGILTSKETEFVKDALVAEAQTAMGTPSATPLDDFPGPIPEKGTFRPSLNVEQIPTPGILPVGQEGKEVQSRRVVSRSLSPPVRLPAVPYSPPDQPPLLEPEETRILTQAEKGGVATYATTLEKVTAPLGRNRPHPEFVADLVPIPTVKSPMLPDKGEMILGTQERSLQPHVGDLAALKRLRVTETETKIAESLSDELFPRKTIPLEPLVTDFEKRGTFAGAESGFSILLVLDTSGSVKGPPLEGIKKSAMEFVSLLRKVDRCAAIMFNDEARLVVPFTSDKNLLRQKIASLQTEGR
ncbi:MAG: VWA domain-containing protein, partial [Deltaproteobacteria bacterium]